MKATLTSFSGNEFNPHVYDSFKLELIRDELQNILDREMKCPIMDSSPGLEDMLCEVIQIMSDFIDYQPSDEEMNPSEPPITMNEMHSAAWAQKQELRK